MARKARKPKKAKVFIAVVGVPKSLKGKIRATYKGKRIPIGFSTR